MRTSRAVISTFNTAIGLDVASTYFTPIWTRFLIAPLSLSFHRASPRLGRCAKHNSKTGFPGLEAQHPYFVKSVLQRVRCSMRENKADEAVVPPVFHPVSPHREGVNPSALATGRRHVAHGRQA